MGSTDPAVVVGYTLLCLGVGALIVSIPVWVPVLWDAMERGADRLAGFLGGVAGWWLGLFARGTPPPLSLRVRIVGLTKERATVEISGPGLTPLLAVELARWLVSKHTGRPVIFLPTPEQLETAGDKTTLRILLV